MADSSEPLTSALTLCLVSSLKSLAIGRWLGLVVIRLRARGDEFVSFLSHDES